eukprot:tig00000241_g21058.t1
MRLQDSLVHVIDGEGAPLLGELECGGEVAGHSTFTQSVFNSCNVLCGVGILALPFALMKSGWAGLLFLGFLAALTNYTGKILIYCIEEYPGVVTYPDLAQAVFGRAGRLGVAAVLYTELFCTVCVFYIVEGDNLAQLFFPGAEAAARARYVNLFMALSSLAILPTSWLRDLSRLAYVSVLGMASALFLLLVVLSDGLFGGALAGLDPADPAFALVNLQNLPLMFGLVTFSFTGHGVFPSIYASMRERRRYGRMLDVTYVVVMLAYAAMGVVGWLQHRGETQQQITLNLPKGPLSLLATALVCVNPVVKTSLFLNPIGLAVEEVVAFESKPAARAFSVAVRSSLVFASLAVAVCCPFFAYLLAFVGSFMTMAVSVFVPAMCYLRTFRGRLPWGTLAWNRLIILFGVVCATSGTYVAVGSILREKAKRAALKIYG